MFIEKQGTHGGNQTIVTHAIFPAETVHPRGGHGFLATCDCGWRGKIRKNDPLGQSTAQEDAEYHLRGWDSTRRRLAFDTANNVSTEIGATVND